MLIYEVCGHFFVDMFVTLLCFSVSVFVSGKSEGKRVKIEPVYEFSKPSRLSVSMRLQDRNEDGLIEAAEPVKLYVYFQNSGEGSAFRD